MKKRNSKLSLSRETIKRLDGDLSVVIGGTCWSATSDCGAPLCPDDRDTSANGCVSGNLC